MSDGLTVRICASEAHLARDNALDSVRSLLSLPFFLSFHFSFFRLSRDLSDDRSTIDRNYTRAIELVANTM